MASRTNGLKPSSAVKRHVDPSTPEGLKAFKAAAASYTSKTTTSKAVATAALQKQGMLTPTGRLSKRYAPA